MNRLNHVQLYDNIRLVSILLVVIGHSMTLSLSNSSGLQTESSLILQTDALWMDEALEAVRQVIYSFHMPLFVLLAGAVFECSFKKFDCDFIVKKWNRLIMPYFLTSIVLYLPIRIVVGYYVGDINILKIFWNDVILGKDINYLWFLPMLFEVSVVAAIAKSMFKQKINHLQKLLYFISGIVMWAIAPQIYGLPFQLGRCVEFLLWFFAGMEFEKRRELIADFCAKYVWYFVLCFITLFVVNKKIEYSVLNLIDQGLLKYLVKLFLKTITFLCAILGSVVIIGFLRKYCCGKARILSRLLVKNSFCIYLLHVPFINFLKMVIQQLPKYALIDNIAYLLILAGICVLSIILSVWVGMVWENSIRWRYSVNRFFG